MKTILKLSVLFFIIGLLSQSACIKDSPTDSNPYAKPIGPATQPCNDLPERPEVNARLIPFGKLSKEKVGATVAAAGNKILFAGGRAFNSSPEEIDGSPRVDIYDQITQTWSTSELSEGRYGMAAATAGNKIFLAGGRNGDGSMDGFFSTVDIFDVSTDTWSVALLSEPRGYIAASAVANKVIFAGGINGWSNYTQNGAFNPLNGTSNRVDIYDISTNKWTTALLSQPRVSISAVTVNNKIYFAGGFVEDGGWPRLSGNIDIYDNITNAWSISFLKQPLGFLTGVNVADKIYWAGGCTVEIKEVSSGISSISQLFKPGSWIIDEGQNAVVRENKIVFFTGSEGSNKFNIYDVATNFWSIGVLDQNIAGASIISVNNTIYVAGGYVNGVLSDQVWKLEF